MTHDPLDERAWLFNTLGGQSTADTQSYLVRPNRETPRLLLPLSSRQASATSLRRHHDGRSTRSRLAAFSGELLARAGGLRFATGDVEHFGSFGLIDELASALDEPSLLAAIATGPPRRNRKPVIQLIRPNGTSVGFAKVGWSAITKDLISNEAAWLKRVAGQLPRPFDAPRVLLEHSTESLTVVVTSSLRTDVTTHQREPLSHETIGSLGACLGVRTQSIESLPQLDLWADDNLVPSELLDALCERHGEQQVHVGFWHADLTPWNSATTRPTRRSTPVTQIWDWEFSADDRPIGFDVLHSSFESSRRAQPNNELAAINTVTASAPDLLSPFDQPVDACIDLYLAELIARETRLAGEGWEPSNLGRLDLHAITALRQRLG